MPANPPWCVPDPDHPRHWLGSSPLLDLDDPKLRLKAQSLTQLCKTEREKALAIYSCVKRIPFSKSFKMRPHTAREVLQQAHGDSADKATLLVALLRLAAIPARIRYLTLDGAVLRGLIRNSPDPLRPVVEVFREGRWCATDTYIFDAAYMAAARRRLQGNGWSHGWGVAAAGATLWDGLADAYAGGLPPSQDDMVLRDHGLFCDPLEFLSSPDYRETHGRVARAVQWNMLAPLMERAIRELRFADMRTEYAHPSP